jgi:hypothetical protein
MAICAWCNEEIAEDSEVFGFGARLREGIDLEDLAGEVIRIFSTAANRMIRALVVTSDSEAKADGFDLMFMTCSRDCAEALKAALEEEQREADAVIYLD